MPKIELLAPVGSFASLQAAIKAGCDSVYFGVHQLHMRARSAHNFSLEELTEVVKICKKAKVKTHITLNCLLYDHDLILMRKIIDNAKSKGVDALIVQDAAAISYAQEIEMQIHGSTQLSISNFESLKFYAKYFDTIVLARELDLKTIKYICNKIKEEQIKGPSGKLVKIEIFGHGALCIAQSGRCQMSILQANASAQRGACLHECRKKYRIIEDETGKELMMDNEFIMSPKDLCTLPFLDQVVDTGISVLKIEGRGRSADYVDTVIRVYRQALDSIEQEKFSQHKVDKWMKELEKVYNRGLCDGYYLGKPLPDFSCDSGNKSSEEKTYIGQIQHYYDKAKIAEINVSAHSLAKGDRIVIIGNTTGVIYSQVESMMERDKFVEKSGKSSLITIPLDKKVRHNDKVYVVRERKILNSKF
ncbi:collagenase [Candidatus Peregrinibacteria bacterium RIFOXYA12_FULL_33_12]|nr:MAG: collagenase [Candidatus Peregrinibacteria bacterium RIFOXYA2_FULL_33_21]OGJ46664.1 MAG: collagenase [Candidatus Peregrinibacteria bacterium RIFOXYA12_FULL_33_12]OGJ51809.1 MAG: collagenase [Candidatus Peregrinibacteria bacterium RIFOXYB2_FULL_33_20]